jgi:NAD(P)-dependent dehydrogenase (short-subunit alcohol dehydrogenase family)
MKLNGTVAIVTGGGSGIGKEIAILLARKGAKVAVFGRRYESLIETSHLIKKSGGECLAVQTDVQNLKNIIEAVDIVQDKFSKVDILVNNAGVAIAKPLVEMEEDEWDTVINTNLKSIYSMCKVVIPHMLKVDGAVIVNISSILGKSGLANFTSYSASKFGILGLTQSLAQEYHPNQIRVYAVCPGRTSTDMVRQIGGNLICDLSMSPQKVASVVVKIITRKYFLRSGKDIVVDNQSLLLRSYEVLKKLLLPLISKEVINSCKAYLARIYGD